MLGFTSFAWPIRVLFPSIFLDVTETLIMLLEQALNLIVDNTSIIGVENVGLEACCGRVCTSNNQAILPIPCYDQSTRDGYAVRGEGRQAGKAERVFQICGEIQAGPCNDLSIERDEAYRIMTGGLIPDKTDRIIPQERCRVVGTELLVDRDQQSAANRFIRQSGTEYGAGDVIVEDGTRLKELHAARFASSGNRMLEVYRKPRVAYLCSGSELVIPGDQLRQGQKFSSNHYLLKFLIERYGGIGLDYGVVEDERDKIEHTLKMILASDVDMIISTGGVGPGKYDLFSEILPGLGAVIRYRSLQVRPGRSTLFGTIGNKLYFGLPGPPTAVHILFHECVSPALRKMQGYSTWYNRRVTGLLNHDISLKSSDVLCFKEGRYAIENGALTVQFPGRLQTPNCFIMTVPGVRSYKRGDRVGISLFEP